MSGQNGISLSFDESQEKKRQNLFPDEIEENADLETVHSDGTLTSQQAEDEAKDKADQTPWYDKVPFLRPIILFVGFQLVLFLVFYFIVPRKTSIKILQSVQTTLDDLYNQNFLYFLMIYFTLCAISISTVLPTISILVIIFAVVSKSIIISWAVSLGFYIVIETLLYFAARKFFRKKIDDYVQSFR